MGRKLPWKHPERKQAYTPATMRTPRSNPRLQYNKSPAGTPASSQGSHKKRLDGLYQDGEWFCNCEPRNDAKYFTVKKRGRNNGRGFYTCGTRSCKFFLWEDDAKARQMGEPVSGAQPQLPASSQERNTAQNPVVEAATPPQRARADDVNSLFESSTDDELFWTSVADKLEHWQAEPAGTPCPPGNKTRSLDYRERRLGDAEPLAGATVDTAQKSFEKPQQTSLQDPFTTPANKRTHDVLGGMPTPSVTRNLFSGPDSKRQKTQGHNEGQPASSGLHSPAVTPSRTLDAFSVPKHDDDYDLTEDIMCLLRGQKMDEPILRAVRDSLDKHALRTRGIVKGRDLVRNMLKERDDRIAELQERVVALENKNKQQKESITNFKASIMDLYSKH